MKRLALWILACAVLLVVTTSAAGPLDVQIKDLRAPAQTVSATIELRDVLPDRFRKVVEEGGTLHLLLQTELVQRRPTWDRPVYPAFLRELASARGASAKVVTVAGAATSPTSYSTLPNPMPVVVDIGGAERLNAAERYYVHTTATLGMLAEREVDSVGDALFGRESDAGTLGSLGRLVFRKVVQVSDYFQSISVENRSRPVPGGEILRRK